MKPLPVESPPLNNLLSCLVSADSRQPLEFPVILLPMDPLQISLPRLFDWGERREIPSKRLLYFLALSLAFCEAEGVFMPWIQKLHDFFDQEGLGELYKQFRQDYFKQDEFSYEEVGFQLSFTKNDLVDLIKKSPVFKQDQLFFKNLSRYRRQDIDRFLLKIFSPRQKDILEKALLRESLTKTEKETFSRHIKKKLLAILDPEIQRIAQVLTVDQALKKSALQDVSDSSVFKAKKSVQ